MEVQRTCEVTATPVEHTRMVCERAGRCQPERGAYQSFTGMLGRAIRGFEDYKIIFKSAIAADFFCQLMLRRSAFEVAASTRNQVDSTTRTKTKRREYQWKEDYLHLNP